MSHQNDPPSSSAPLTVTTAPRCSKMAIPRLINNHTPPPQTTPTERSSKRFNHACLGCRSRKVKCDGAKPTCKNCSEGILSCVYLSSRRNRLKIATGHNRNMIALLREMRGQVEEPGRAKIDDMLASVLPDIQDVAERLDMEPEAHEAKKNTGQEVRDGAAAPKNAMYEQHHGHASACEESRSRLGISQDPDHASSEGGPIRLHTTLEPQTNAPYEASNTKSPD